LVHLSRLTRLFFSDAMISADHPQEQNGVREIRINHATLHF